MFTFGLFSTHLPYIAFVLFYGFFFLIGIEKASSEDLCEEERIIQQVISVSVDNHPDIADDAAFKCHSILNEIHHEQLLLYEDKVRLCCSGNILIQGSGYRFSWFSRPPPVI